MLKVLRQSACVEEESRMLQIPIKLTVTIGCPTCGGVPCSCGWMYRKLDRTQRTLLAAAVLGMDSGMLESLPIPEVHPNAGDPAGAELVYEITEED